MMVDRSVISCPENTFRWLVVLAGEVSTQLGRLSSYPETMNHPQYAPHFHRSVSGLVELIPCSTPV